MTRGVNYYQDGMPIPVTPDPNDGGQDWKETRVVGKSLPRVDAYERVSGTAIYPSDVQIPRMLYGAILRCPHAHARVISMDASAARAMPGVAQVLTSQEASGTKWG